MSKFKSGDRVLVKSSTFNPASKPIAMIGMSCEVKHISGIGERVQVWEPDKSDWWVFYESDLELIIPPEEITIDGVVYTRKKEPHVWAWGQWARVSGAQPRYEDKVVLVVGGVEDGYVPFVSPQKWGHSLGNWINHQYLTYISTAEIPE